MQHRDGITPATLAFADQQVEAAVQERRTAETTGSLAGTCDRAPVIQNGQGRDLRSGTRGNTQFPERRPVQQNLGAITGGPES